MTTNILTDKIPIDIIGGLRAKRKFISSKYFYDKKGSELFDQICELEEYYPTRTEAAILHENIASIASCFEDDSLLVEFGSGSSTKTRLLLENIKNLGGYIPIDISKNHLIEVAKELKVEFPNLEILPLAADYTKPLELPKVHTEAEQRIIFFPGSTIGNFTKKESRFFLKTIRNEIRKGDGFILGIDLVKDKSVLEAAYNDSLNVTAEFNLNLLQNLNNLFGANFVIQNFVHDAIYNELENRIEMYLISQTDQHVQIGESIVEFKVGEKLLTEYSHKYTIKMIEDLCDGLFHISKIWKDTKDYFAELFLEPI